MNLSELLTLDMDTARFIVVASIAVGSVVYALRGLAAGGTLTAGYLVILGLGGAWDVILGVAMVTALSFVAIRVVATRHVALPKVAVFVSLVIVSVSVTAALHLTVRHLGTLDLPGGLAITVTVGAYVTPGLIAYDLAHQGFRPTLIGVGSVVIGTLAVVVPVLALANWLQPESTTIYTPVTGNIPGGWFWLAALASTYLASAVRLSFGVRSAGFIGALFLVEFLTVSAFVTVLLAALAAFVLVRVIDHFIVLTPRQRYELAMMLGAMAAWTGLYWGTRLGWAPAQEANAYALEPLLVVGLLASDLGRNRVSSSKVVAGLVLTSAFVWAVTELGASGVAGRQVLAAVLLFAVPAAAVMPAIRTMRAEWRNAVRIGCDVADEYRHMADRA